MRWKNLKKWQRGGLIGCGVGVLLPLLWVLDFIGVHLHWRAAGYLWWIINSHSLFAFPMPLMWNHCFAIGELLFIGATVVFYGGLGAIVGRFQQIANSSKKWLLTGLVAFFLILFYWSNCILYGLVIHD